MVHILPIPPVPERFEEWIGKAECQNVLHRFLAQIMVDAEDLRLLEIGVWGAMEQGTELKIAIGGVSERAQLATGD